MSLSKELVDETVASSAPPPPRSSPPSETTSSWWSARAGSAAAARRDVGDMSRNPLTTSDLAEIEATVRDAETRTAGEIYCVVAEESSDYHGTPIAWAAGVALLAPALLLLAGVQVTAPDTLLYGGWTASQVEGVGEATARAARIGTLLLQAILFVATLLIVSVRPVRLTLTPSAMKRDQVRRQAQAQFLAKNLHTTRERTGVLIYVSFAEQMAELIADGDLHRDEDRLDRRAGDPHRIAAVGAVARCADPAGQIGGQVAASALPLSGRRAALAATPCGRCHGSLATGAKRSTMRNRRAVRRAPASRSPLSWRTTGEVAMRGGYHHIDLNVSDLAAAKAVYGPVLTFL
eukprot:gene26243-34333_t